MPISSLPTFPPPMHCKESKSKTDDRRASSANEKHRSKVPHNEGGLQEGVPIIDYLLHAERPETSDSGAPMLLPFCEPDSMQPCVPCACVCVRACVRACVRGEREVRREDNKALP